MSKKLIAVAAAAALALTSLVGVAPASATTITSVKINADTRGQVGGTETVSHAGTTSISAATYMSSRTLDHNSDTLTTTRNVIRFDVTTSSATTITVSSTLGVFVVDSIVDSAGAAQKITAGVQSMSGSTITGNLVYTFYAYNNSTTVGKLTISTAGSTNTYNVKGTVGTGYNLLDVKFPTSIVSGLALADSTQIISFQVTDAFGNQLTAAGAPDSVVVGIFGATVSAAAYSTVRKQYEATVHGTATSSVAMSVTLQAPDLSANGFAKPVTYAFSSVSSANLATQVTNLTAQVATLTAQLAVSRLIEDSVTQKKYNTLARKWNKANPGAKVALKK
jgi:hypothetical protein